MECTQILKYKDEIVFQIFLSFLIKKLNLI